MYDESRVRGTESTLEDGEMTEGWAEGGEGPEEIGWNLEPKGAETALCGEESEWATTVGAERLCIHIISIRQTLALEG